MNQNFTTAYPGQDNGTKQISGTSTTDKVFDFLQLGLDASKAGVNIINGNPDSRRNNNFNPMGAGYNYGQVPMYSTYVGCPYPYNETVTPPPYSNFYGGNNFGIGGNFGFNQNQPNVMPNYNSPYFNTAQPSVTGYPGFWNTMYGK